MKKRIFIAVDISEPVRRKIADYILELKKEFSQLKAGWLSCEKLHLTLKFLGETEETQLEQLITICEKIADRMLNFRLQISNTGVFHSGRNAGVLWLGVEGDIEELQKINSILEDGCEKIGFEKEKRIYQPHLTIARIRQSQNSRRIVEFHLGNKFEPVECEVFELAIYESKLQPTGSIYQKIKSFSFQSP
ncbi:MAG: RNA 2',3'-cyclic phosphodiesterase [Pyrinomonadaceae bacterium]